jgi:hypothetical protein
VALFERVLEEKENDKDTSSLTVTRYRQVWEHAGFQPSAPAIHTLIHTIE